MRHYDNLLACLLHCPLNEPLQLDVVTPNAGGEARVAVTGEPPVVGSPKERLPNLISVRCLEVRDHRLELSSQGHHGVEDIDAPDAPKVHGAHPHPRAVGVGPVGGVVRQLQPGDEAVFLPGKQLGESHPDAHPRAPRACLAPRVRHRCVGQLRLEPAARQPGHQHHWREVPPNCPSKARTPCRRQGPEEAQGRHSGTEIAEGRPRGGRPGLCRRWL
mmetsp:Transcript_39388/g.117910  ORF Transcript_39388/g.117910 Transcript_39388/m.117910 type:complete len:217 (+) Transcript_39388:740-1390(+)